MAMLHPDDEHYWLHNALLDNQIESLFYQKCGSKPSSIARPADLRGAYHLVAFCRVALDAKDPMNVSDVVLRVSRPCIPQIKTENEVAIMQHLQRHTSIPLPKIHFWDNTEDNVLNHEYICMERIPHPTFNTVLNKLSESALDHVLSQVVDFFIQIRHISPSSGHRMLGGLRFDNGAVLTSHPDAPPTDKYIIPGPVVEETFWQTPDIIRYWNSVPELADIKFNDLNAFGPFECWVDWVLAWLRSYEMQVLKHPRLEFCRGRIGERLSRVVELLEAPEPVQWLQDLKNNEGGRSLYLSSKDLHGGNILVDEQGTIYAFIDWEFAGFVPSFERQSDPVQGFVWMAKHELGPDNVPPALENWAKRFSEIFHERNPADHAAWIAENNSESLGAKGAALHDLRNYLRCVIEVCVRDQGNVKAGKGAWTDRVEKALQVLLVD
ncbi:hypothetical protein FRC10_005000 [Ceratobasidium sp. 414]|nr:hypothetical protein FRC10_005000 [Ceratobasidium sp. 414]